MKQNHLTQKKIALIILCAFLLMTLSLNVSVSYLIKERVRDNVFGLGRVELSLTEDAYPAEAESRLLAPKSIVPKNPRIVNTGSTDIYVFLSVTVPYDNVQLIDEEGAGIHKPNALGKHLCELFDLLSDENGAYNGAGTAHFSDSFTVTDVGVFEYAPEWCFLRSSENAEKKTHTYLFGYRSLLTTDSAHRTTTPLFDRVQLRNILEGELPENLAETVTVNAYGIQSQQLRGNVTVANPEAVTVQELTDIYRLYENQEGR